MRALVSILLLLALGCGDDDTADAALQDAGPDVAGSTSVDAHVIDVLPDASSDVFDGGRDTPDARVPPTWRHDPYITRQCPVDC